LQFVNDSLHSGSVKLNGPLLKELNNIRPSQQVQRLRVFEHIRPADERASAIELIPYHVHAP
jgi:hypothetical protein